MGQGGWERRVSFRKATKTIIASSLYPNQKTAMADLKDAAGKVALSEAKDTVLAAVHAIGPEGHSPNDMNKTALGTAIEGITNSLRSSICVVNGTDANIEVAVEKQFWTDSSCY